MRVSTKLRGIAASPGVVIGRAVVIGASSLRAGSHAESGKAAIERWSSAREEVKASLEQLVRAAERNSLVQEQALLEAQQMMVMDPGLEESVRAMVLGGTSAERATHDAIERYAVAMDRFEDAYLRQRSSDVREIGQALLRVLAGQSPFPIANLAPGSVLCAAELGAASLLMLDRAALAGIALGSGGPTSHVAILARSWGVPAVLGITGLLDTVSEGDLLALDGGRGELWVQPSADEQARLEANAQKYSRDKAELTALRDRQAVTVDGVRVELLANIGGPQDVVAALEAGAEGVGLFRTEFLVTGRRAVPSEREQREIYGQVLEGMEGRPVTVRTFDIGGDKQVPALDLKPELNPFLGYRGIRMGLDRPELLATQLRALLTAAAGGPQLKVMLPMISTLDEVRQARAILDRARSELGPGSGDGVLLGVMIEIPAAALLASQLAREVQFFSIGTNDLIQYTMAADRTNDRVARLYQPFHPAVLRLIGQVAAAATGAGIPCGVCGEMAGDPRATALLLGLGIRELSMSPGSIAAVKRQVLRIQLADAQRLAQDALEKATTREVEGLVDAFLARLA
ncbi:phosphoenolpyruvate--protein phosphotransferase [bacterium]|nr:MAG: phosphoenolpyruvate--protein phosphotransferase [bacterium]